MKIAIVHTDFSVKGGAENVIFWLCEDLAEKRNHKVTLFCTDFKDWKEKFEKIKGLKLKVIQIPKYLIDSKFFKMIFAGIYLKNELRNFDVINIHNFPASLWVGIANIISGKKLPKIIWSCNEPPRFLYKKHCNLNTPSNLEVLHEDLNENLEIKYSSKIKYVFKELYKPLLKYIDRKSVRKFYKILTLSNFVKNQVEHIYENNKVVTCYTGVKDIDTGNISNHKTGQEYFLTISRLETCKNIQNIVESFSRIKENKQFDKIKYNIIGKGPLENYLRNMILKNNLNDTVFLLGYVSREELLSYYKNCLAVIYLPYDEPFGLPYLEAAYFSKPSIASNHGGPAELVINGKTGLLVSPSDINEISNAIKTISKDKDAAEIMGNNANKFLKEKFLWEMYINRFLTQIQ